MASFDRRYFLIVAASASSVLGAKIALARIPTPPQTAGPFYPRQIPVDSDADLVRVVGRPAPARGIVTHLGGRVVDRDGHAVSGIKVEIWQCDALGQYHHPLDGGGRDPNFQGYGFTTSDEDGGYRFRTIRPVPYPGRTPHIHFAMSDRGVERLTTQMYVAGEPLNDSDFVLNRIRDPNARVAVIVPFRPAADDGPADAQAATFDIILGTAMLEGK